MSQGPAQQRLVPACRVSLAGAPLDPALDAALTKVDVDLDVDLFGRCTLTFNDPQLALVNGEKFTAGLAVKVELGFAAALRCVFEGEVVALEPQFRRDLPCALQVVCDESLHRLALSAMTRTYNDSDGGEIVTQVARAHGLSAEGPSGTKEYALQQNTSDATFLRRLAQRQGHHLRLEGKKLVVGTPPSGEELTLGPTDGLRKLKVKIKAGPQVQSVAVHGFDPNTKRDFSGKAEGKGEIGEGARQFGSGAQVAIAGHEHQPSDMATAEAMARGRMRKLAEGHVTAQVELGGDPRLVPGVSVSLDKIGNAVDGSWRVERARHQFARHGYFVTMSLVRTSRLSAGKAARERALAAAAEQARAAAQAPKKIDGRLARPRWRSELASGKQRATLAVDAANLAGRKVLLVLETRAGSGWKEVARATAEVKAGVASAEVELKADKSHTLIAPKWKSAKDAKHAHGEQAEVEVRTTAPDKADVRIVLEQRAAKAGVWEQLDALVAKVLGGIAKASFDLTHPHHREQRKAHSALLQSPTWTRKPSTHGEAGTVRVRTPGLAEGRSVKFLVEQRGADGKWGCVQSAEGKVAGGEASASLELRHPGTAPAPAHSAVLGKPRWELPRERVAHGDTLTASVEAPGLEGRRVKFTFERSDGKKWCPVAQETVQAKGGSAKASLQGNAPGGRERLRFRTELLRETGPLKLRFRAEPVADHSPSKLRFRGELLVPQDPSLTRLRASVVGGGAAPVETPT